MVALLRFGLRVDGVACFWAAYVHPAARRFASLGDLLSQPTSDGGLGIGTITTSTVFLAAILVVVGATSVRLRRSSAALTDGSVEAVRLRRSPAAD